MGTDLQTEISKAIGTVVALRVATQPGPNLSAPQFGEAARLLLLEQPRLVRCHPSASPCMHVTQPGYIAGRWRSGTASEKIRAQESEARPSGRVAWFTGGRVRDGAGGLTVALWTQKHHLVA